MDQPLALAAPRAAADTAPAGGAPVDQLVGMTVVLGAFVALVLALGLVRSGGRMAELLPVQRWGNRTIAGLPGWAAIPAGLVAAALPVMWFGIYWDVSIHIDRGRDAGPLPNPGHWIILGGVLVVFAAGWLAMVMPTERPGAAAVRVTGDWYAPVGGLVLIAAALFVLIQFPLDDASHRLYGQDVTVWSPTHLLLLFGNPCTAAGLLLILFEGRFATRGETPDPPRRRLARLLGDRRVQVAGSCGALLVGLSLYQLEWDFGVPQFRLLYQAIIVPFTAAVALVAARILGGRGAALGAAVLFIAVRGIVSVLVSTEIVGIANTDLHFALYLVEALVVEILALRVDTDRVYRFALAAGVGIGTVGIVAEHAWTQVWMPLPWPGSALPEAIAVGVPAAMAGGLVGGFVASALSRAPSGSTGLRAAMPALAGLLVLTTLIAAYVGQRVPEGARAVVTLADVRPPPQREVSATIRLRPVDLGRKADFLIITAWQGGEPRRLIELRRSAPGLYRANEPIPVHGSWKSWLRVARGDVLAALPVYLPEDTAIPAPEVPAPPRFDRAFVPDVRIMQRERRDDVPGWLWAAGYVAALLLGSAMVGGYGWALWRVATSSRRPPPARLAAGRRPRRKQVRLIPL